MGLAEEVTSMTSGVLMVSGSVLFLVGAGIAVPRVFTEPDSEQRLRMLAERLWWWRLGQPLYALGALVAALGVGALAADDRATDGTWFQASCALLVLGALAWSLSVYRRAVRPRDFALGRLPGWPFAAYVWLTLCGLLLLGAGLLAGGWPDALGWIVLGADALFVVGYLRYRDIPPFVFYVLLSVVGFAVL
jgi:hypothetical protein